MMAAHAQRRNFHLLMLAEGTHQHSGAACAGVLRTRRLRARRLRASARTARRYCGSCRSSTYADAGVRSCVARTIRAFESRGGALHRIAHRDSRIDIVMTE
jgi:hypothetical protein